MEDQEFIDQLAEKLSKLGTVRPLGFHYLHPYGTVPADSIICNGATYSRALYKDFFDYITTQGWVKTEAEWQEIAERGNGFCPFYSDGDGSTNFRTPKFAPYQQTTTYHQAGLPNITGSFNGPFLWDAINGASGALSVVNGTDTKAYPNGSDPQRIIEFDASRSSPIYGRSSTVQPESHEWVMCVVAYGIATNTGSVDIQNVMSATTQVQAEIANIQQAIGNIQQAIGNIAKFAAPDYGAGSTIEANTTVTIQSNGFIGYNIRAAGSGRREREITINGTTLTLSAGSYSTDQGILPVLKGDSVRHNGVDGVTFYPPRYGV